MTLRRTVLVGCLLAAGVVGVLVVLGAALPAESAQPTTAPASDAASDSASASAARPATAVTTVATAAPTASSTVTGTPTHLPPATDEDLAGTPARAPGEVAGATAWPVNGVYVLVDYDGDWQGNVGTLAGSASVAGSGDDVIEVATGDDVRSFHQTIVSAAIQKLDGSTVSLTVRVVEDGEVIAVRTTTAPYGVVTLTVEV